MGRMRCSVLVDSKLDADVGRFWVPIKVRGGGSFLQVERAWRPEMGSWGERGMGEQETWEGRGRKGIVES